MGINQAVNAVMKKSLFVLCGQNVEFLSVKPVGTKSNFWAVRELQLCSKFTVIFGKSSFRNCIEVRFMPY